jgi:LDH2 family malate/lactate/ureidoglycolate dehydrogenase
MLWVNDNGVLRVVAPPGGTEPEVSTNPISIGVPTNDGPLVFDMSTSVVAQGKILIHRLDGKPCPEGWLQDAEGNPTTDPTVLRADPPGSILPTGGEASYKGFGLSLLFDTLVGGLSGGFCPPPQPGATLCNTVLVVVWDPTQMAGREHFLTQASGLVASVRRSRRKPGVDEIRLPGDRSRRIRSERLEQGIPVREGTWRELTELAERHRVDVPV